MPNLSELLHIDVWLKAKLEAAPGLDVPDDISGAFQGVVPANRSLPAVRFHAQSPGSDVTVINGVRVWADPLYLVAAVVEGSPVPLLPLADAIDSALHRASGETSTIRVLSCVREAPYQLTEVSDGRTFRHAGGMYRIKTQAK